MLPRRHLPLALCLVLLPLGGLGAQAAASRPRTPADTAAVGVARATFGEVERALAARRWAHADSTVRCSDEDEGAGELSVTVDRDSAGVVRHFAWGGGSDDHGETHRYFYDAAGRLRFAFFTLGAVNDTRYEERVYYGPRRDVVRRLTRLVAGPGYPTEPEPGVFAPDDWLRGYCSWRAGVPQSAIDSTTPPPQGPIK